MIRVSYARKESGSSQNWTCSSEGERLFVKQRVGMAEFPKSAESRYNGKPPLPYGSRSVKPVKWGKIKTLNVVSDTDSSLGVMGVKAG